jgi:hypothetical protein
MDAHYVASARTSANETTRRTGRIQAPASRAALSPAVVLVEAVPDSPAMEAAATAHQLQLTAASGTAAAQRAASGNAGSDRTADSATASRSAPS